MSCRPLASALNLTWRVDPALIRFTLRLAVLMVAGVVVFKTWALPHGYWLPFTVIVVLQPDYGSTRQRAAPCLARRSPREQQGQLDVLERIQNRKQVVALKDEPNTPRAVIRLLAVGQPRKALALQQHLAAFEVLEA